LWMLERRPFAAGLLLAWAVQIKLTAVFLVPLFLFSQRGRPAFTECVAGGIVGGLPLVFSYAHFQSISFPSQVNPYYFNPFEHHLFLGNPLWLTIVDQLATYGALVALSVWMIHDENVMHYVPSICFFVVMKLTHHAQPWFMLLLPSFVLALRNRRARFWLFLLAPLLDAWSLLEMIAGPFGYTVDGYYDGLTVIVNICNAL